MNLSRLDMNRCRHLPEGMRRPVPRDREEGKRYRTSKACDPRKVFRRKPESLPHSAKHRKEEETAPHE
jgi:hypothetical protein